MASYLHNLDLCLLAYQMYHQSMVWPLDPWYEVMAKGPLANRRDNFMRRVHQAAAAAPPVFDPRQCSGPAAIRGWGNSNERLDPVISSYRSLNPRSPAWTMDGGQFLAIQTPGYVVDKIQTVEIAKYNARPTALMTSGVDFDTLQNYPNGTDHLIAFEGGTGVIEDSDPPAWSMMGFVLMRTRKGGKHDIHIVFRGSRSGSAGRALMQAQFQSKGNPDWVTDMTSERISDTWISKVGKVCKGFSRSVKTCFGTIRASLLRLHQQYGAPETIWVTGHSLGASLAVLFTSSVAIGMFGDNIKREMPTWPWSRIVCLPYAMPVVGDKDFMRVFDLMVFCRYVWVEGDVVVYGGRVMTKSQHVGAGVQLDKPDGARDNPHETFLIRAAAVNYAQTIRVLNPIAADVANATPWACYHTFREMLNGINPFSYLAHGSIVPNIITLSNIRSTLRYYRFGEEFDKYLEIFKEVIQMRSSHKRPRFFVNANKQTVRANDITGHQGEMQGDWIKQNLTSVLNDLDTELTAFEGSKTDKYIGLGLILTVLEKSSFPTNNLLNELISRPNIRACLDYNPNS
jgi:hypothetical protein